jgi:Conserved TM helix
MREPLASVSFSQSVQNLLDTVFNSLPKILVFLVVLVVGWIIAKVLQRILVSILHRVHFDNFAERGAVGTALKRSKYTASTLLAMIVYYAILLITLQMAFGVFGNNPISTMLNAIVGWIPKLIVAIVLIVVASAIAKVVKDLLTGMLGGLSYGKFVASAASVLIILLGVFAALDQVGIANSITNPILYGAIATVGAILAIGVGGGAIKPMQERWERILTGAERETTRQVSAYQQGRTDAMRAPSQENAATGQQNPMPGQDDYGANP